MSGCSITWCLRAVVVNHLGLRFCSAHAAEWFGGKAPGRDAGQAVPSARPHGADRRGRVEPLSSAAASAPLSEDEVLDILENDGWRDFEVDLCLERGQTLGEFADEITARWDL